MSKLLLVFLGPLVLAITPVRGDVKMPALFGDHMLLQRQLKIPVWGWADPGEEIKVALGDHQGKAIASKEGTWRVDLEPIATASEPLILTVSGKNSVKFEDVLIGDVWICSGQSNMEFPMARAHNTVSETPKATDSQIRLFLVSKKTAGQPQKDVTGKWMVCSPETVKGFSAVGYFFARELRETTKEPIGLIATYWGGTPAQAWTSLSGLTKEPPFEKYVKAATEGAAHETANREAYPQLLEKYEAEKKKWNEEYGKPYDAALKEWAVANKEPRAKGQPAPAKPKPSQPEPHKPLPDQDPHTPTVLFNGMVAPLMPFALKGVVWYQGEANGGAGAEYRTLFPRLINDWREKWGQGDFPFLFVQLANYLAPQKAPVEGGWAALREAQLMTLALPNTGMAVAIDIGNGNDIHPKDKLDVGHRLALAARHLVYGEKIVYSGPIYDSMKVEGKSIRLTFKNTGGGLVMGAPPWAPDGLAAPPATELKGFAIAGATNEWVWARATIDHDTVVVSADGLADPKAVRYGWANNPACDLYNKEGLPASPFRTDPETPQ